jgi:excinuclease ABC subunit A
MAKLVYRGTVETLQGTQWDVIRCSDWIIDLGPEGGDWGSEVLVTGTPEEDAQHATSHTGQYLCRVLEQHPPEVVEVEAA